jgi:hypothetical protein
MNFIIFIDSILFVIVVIMFRDMYAALRKIKNNPEIAKRLIHSQKEKHTNDKDS